MTDNEPEPVIVPVLEQWLTAQQAAEQLGISRQSVARMMNEGTFQTLHAVGDRPLYVIHQDEIDRYGGLYDELGNWAAAAEALKKETFDGA